MSRIAQAIWELVESLTFAGAIFVVCYLFFFQVSEVKGASSYPTLQNDQRLIVDKISYRFSDPQRGDFVIIYSPDDKNIDFVKRIIGLPDETIKIADCSVYIDGHKLTESYLQPGVCTRGGAFLRDNASFSIPNGDYVVMGDNRSNSSDSRAFGPVTRDAILGKVQLRLFPLTRF